MDKETTAPRERNNFFVFIDVSLNVFNLFIKEGLKML